MMSFQNGKMMKNKDEDKSTYWFTRNKIDKILKVHDYLDSFPEIGKVLSFGSIIRVAEDLNKKTSTKLRDSGFI